MTLRIAVTGASGFVGGHVLRVLASRECEVVAASRDKSRLAGARGETVELVQLDMNEPRGAFDALGRPDVVIHLAWGGLPHYRQRRHVEEELPLQYAFLSALVADGLANLTVSGSCLEYGSQDGPLGEDLPGEPNTAYGIAKQALCQKLERLRQQRRFNLTWARLFYMYGAGQSENSLWPQLMAALQRGDQRFDMSGGEQLRDFLPVEAVAETIVQLALKRADLGSVNVCSGRPRSVRSLVEGWIADAGGQIELNLGHYPYPDYEPMAFWGNADKLQSILGPA